MPLESRCHTTNTICLGICSSETEAQPANWTHKCKAYFHQLCLVFSYKPQHLSDTPTCKQLPYTHTQSHSEREERRASAGWDIESDDITNHRDNQDGVISKPWTNRLLTTTTRRDDGNHFLKDLLLYTIRQNIYPAYYFMTKCCMLMRCYNKYMIPVMYAELRRDECSKRDCFDQLWRSCMVMQNKTWTLDSGNKIFSIRSAWKHCRLSSVFFLYLQ